MLNKGIPIRILLLVVATIAICSMDLPVCLAEEEEVLTNESIIKMVELGLHGELIIAKIKSSKCDFDTSSESLMELLKKGVKVEVIKAMIAEDAHPSKVCPDGEAPTESVAVTAPDGIADRNNMVLIKGGCYMMGDGFGMGREDERPVHEVCVDDFYLSRHEVTLKEYREFMNEKGFETEAARGLPCWFHSGKKWGKVPGNNWHNVGYAQEDDHPVTCVSWNDAVEYVNWRSAKDNVPYRLPTEAEWEYAARAGGKHYLYSWGNDLPSGNISDEAVRLEYPDWVIWEGYNDGFTFTAPVGSFEPNELGIYDLTGNVWEWTQDNYVPDYYSKSPKENPKGAEDSIYRTLKGGSWFDAPSDIRNAYRSWNYPTLRNFYNGFRLAAPAN